MYFMQRLRLRQERLIHYFGRDLIIAVVSIFFGYGCITRPGVEYWQLAASRVALLMFLAGLFTTHRAKVRRERLTGRGLRA